jgi:hypothetical protein
VTKRAIHQLTAVPISIYVGRLSSALSEAFPKTGELLPASQTGINSQGRENQKNGGGGAASD